MRAKWEEDRVPEKYSPSDQTLDRAQLEQLAVSAIREHRALLASDQLVYEEWTRASEDPSVPPFIIQSLQEEYMSRQKRSETQQERLSDIIETLGFVPDVRDVETQTSD
ncbi:transcriptional regulator [Agrobacterium sp. S2]|nr:transcriptional regulator [Agrobacterium sp. S2]